MKNIYANYVSRNRNELNETQFVFYIILKKNIYIVYIEMT